MCKIRDYIINHPGKTLGGSYKTYGYEWEKAEQSFIKSMHTDIENYLAQQVQPEKKGAQYKKPKVTKKTKSELQNTADWAYDEMVDNRMTLGI